MRCWVPKALGAALLLIMVLGTSPGQPPKGKPGKPDSLFSSLRDVINHGAELFNEYGDYAGCYRVYQGALIAIRPQLVDHPDLLKEVDESLKKAERMPRLADRAFSLRNTLDHVRAKFRPEGTEKKPEKKPEDKKPEKKPEDKKPEKKPEDKKPEKKPEDKKPEKKPEDKKPEKTEALWKRLGGEDGVTKIVDDFMKLASKNPKVNASRDGKFKHDDEQKAELKRKLVEFISQATGGPLKYTGRSMKEAHKGMRITDEEFNAAGADLRKALKENDIKKEDADALLKIVGSTRKDIVEVPAKKKDDEPKKEETKKDDVKKDDVKKDDTKKDDVKKDGVKKDDVKKKDAKKDEKKDLPKVDKDDASKLSGKVQFKTGTTGYLTLIGKDRRTFSTFVHADGSYAFRIALPPGEYRVVLETARKEGDPPVATPFPERLLDPDQSGLTVRLNPGDNVVDINLK